MMPSRAVAICGAGELGRRHLEGVLRSEHADIVHVYDIREDALAACELVVRRSGEARKRQPIAELRLHHAIRTLPTSLNLAIVATTADVRPHVVSQLAEHAHIPHWILEKVLAQDEPGLDQLCSATSASLAWVNTPRRTMEWYHRLRSLIGGRGKISMVVSGGAWGLACNAVHFMDVLAWWSGERPLGIDTEALDPEWLPAKRKGFLEVFGSMSVVYTEGSRLTLTADHDAAPIEIKVDVGGLVWLISDSEKMARRSDGLELPGRVDLQSEMSAGLVDLILATSTCSLPTLADSVEIHRLLLRGLRAHLIRSGGSGNHVPIT